MIVDYPVNSLDNIGFVCIESKYNGKWVLCFHNRRQRWESPGGHVEKGETPLEAAKRELFEETGAIDFEIIPLWDYSVINDEGEVYNNGRVYYAEIKSFADLPSYSEMNKIDFFSDLPDSITYDRDEMMKIFNKAEKLYKEYRNQSSN